mgnify:CR=1 FL=1
MRIKVCGLTREDDAMLASQLGAWALGFIFYSKSPRNITVESAADIIKNVRSRFENPPICVAVVVNEEIESLRTILAETGVDYIQFHGDESPEDCGKHSNVIKAFRLFSKEDIQVIQSYKEGIDYCLIDAAVKGEYGGTGVLSDWSLAKSVKEIGIPLLLSGGLSPENMEEAWQEVQPYALDLSSGLEASKGIKDHSKIEKLFEIGRKYGTVSR